jgi:hypothetical protein
LVKSWDTRRNERMAAAACRRWRVGGPGEPKVKLTVWPLSLVKARASSRFLIEARPGAGKTTAARRLVQLLRESGVQVSGITTPEIREGRQRLGFAIEGSPFKDAIQTVTGFQMTELGPQVAGWVDWVYMLSMLLIGLGLILGIGTRLAAVGGNACMAIFKRATEKWPEHNPLVDVHVGMGNLLDIVRRLA